MINGKFIHAVVSGEKYEGYRVCGIFSSEEAAIAAARQLVASENADDGSFEAVKDGIDDVARWESSHGSYYIEVVRWPADRLF